MNDVGASVRGVTHVRRARDPEHRVVRRATPRRATDCVIVVVVVVVATAAAVVVVVVVVVELAIECECERTETTQTDTAARRRTRDRRAVEARAVRDEPVRRAQSRVFIARGRSGRRRARVEDSCATGRLQPSGSGATHRGRSRPRRWRANT